MAVAHRIGIRHEYNNLEENKISNVGIKQLVSIQLPKLKTLILSKLSIELGWNNIGSVGCKWLTKIKLPNL